MALIVAMAGAVSGQERAPLSLSQDAAYRPHEGVVRDSRMPDPNVGLIRLDVTVTDKNGNSVTGLQDKDFTLHDNQQTNKIVTFQAFNGGIQPANTLEIVLVIDELNLLVNEHSGRQLVSAANREVETFLRASGRALPYPVMIYRLTRDGLFSTQQASTDGSKIANQVEHGEGWRRIWSPREIEADTAKLKMQDGVMSRVTHSIIALGSISLEERRKPGRKLMFWIGNGWRIEKSKAAGISDFSIELLTRMREARISLWSASAWPLYDSDGAAYKAGGSDEAVGGASPVNTFVYDQYLKGPKTDSTDLEYLSLPVLAKRSGGGELSAHSDLAAKINDKIGINSRFYSITFDPSRTRDVDDYHHLEIEISSKDLTAHHVEDYYDQPVFYDQPPVRQPITVKELKALVSNAHAFSRSELVRRIQALQLTERLDGSELSKLEGELQSSEARDALVVVANESVFLEPPAEQILSSPVPDRAAQRQIVTNVVSYVNITVAKLPDVSADRTTTQFHEMPKPDQTWKTAMGNESLYQAETIAAHIRFHAGKEEVKDDYVMTGQSLFSFDTRSTRTDELAKRRLRNSNHDRLQTIGTFGPILVTVMTGASLSGSTLEWARWEKSEDGPLAVFRYRVPENTSLLMAEYCCLAIDLDDVRFQEPARFHGEIAVNPSTGAVMRLTAQADLSWRQPLDLSEVMVEYRPIRKSSRTFICPSRAISISRQRRTVALDRWGEHYKVYGPYQTLLNEIRFQKYQIFGSTYRILPGYTEEP